MFTICILTKNAASTLRQTLNSTQGFSEIILVDNGSSDETVEIAKSFPNVKVHNFPFIGFGALRNKAAELASNDWILALDSDEVLSIELIDELQGLLLNDSLAYQMPRHNFYRGKRVRSCGWDPEWVLRLYNRKTSRFSDSLVHEKLIAKHFYTLHSPILHTPYRSTSDFLSKMEHYSTLFAEQNSGKKILLS